MGHVQRNTVRKTIFTQGYGRNEDDIPAGEGYIACGHPKHERKPDNGYLIRNLDDTTIHADMYRLFKNISTERNRCPLGMKRSPVNMCRE